MNVIDGILSTLKNLEKRILRLECQGSPRWVFADSPLRSSSWDGDAHSSTAKTLIDLSSVFGVPAGIKAILVHTGIRDSGSATNDCWMILSPVNTDSSGSLTRCFGLANDSDTNQTFIVSCDANGDIYYQISASGVNTLDAWIEIMGYLI